jgi:predicted GIY-YIG superfamily endonuclease
VGRFADLVDGSGAPDAPGIYVLLDAATELLYVGKAARLRRRLHDHARAAEGTGHGRLRRLYQRTREVRWQELADEGEAARREADLIVALRPAFNASHRDDGRWAYVVVEEVAPGPARLRFTLSSVPGPAARAPGPRTYGCFLHLGRGVSSRPGVACSDGYPALLRLLWAASAGPRDRMPSVLTRVAPDAAEVAVDAALRRPLHDLLAGTSARLLGELAERHQVAPPLLRPGLARDQVAAAGFFEHGPEALRRLRRAHAVGPGPLSRPSIEDLLVADLRRAIGPFRRPPADPTGALLGRRSRPWAAPSPLTGRRVRRRPGRGPGSGPRRPSGRGG